MHTVVAHCRRTGIVTQLLPSEKLAAHEANPHTRAAAGRGACGNVLHGLRTDSTTDQVE
jgi:hypothetical protein